MDWVSFATHLLNFFAPACALAAWMALVGPWWVQGRPSWLAWKRQFLLNSVIGGLVLVTGWLWLGHDGKVITYAAMVLACASTQWLLTL
jgi:hypothetical protein